MRDVRWAVVATLVSLSLATSGCTPRAAAAPRRMVPLAGRGIEITSAPLADTSFRFCATQLAARRAAKKAADEAARRARARARAARAARAAAAAARARAAKARQERERGRRAIMAWLKWLREHPPTWGW